MFQKIGRRFLIYWRIFWLTIGYWFFGIEIVNEALLKTTLGASQILRHFGASIGTGCVIHSPLIIHNADINYANLVVGHRVHIGRGVFFDLSGSIQVNDEAVISMNCTLLTHQDVGERPLKSIYSPQIHHLQIGKGAYLGAGVTVLAGASVGKFSVIGAGAVLTRSLSPYHVAVGIPAKVVKSLSKEDIVP